MSGEQSPFEREVRDTIVRSSFTGVAASVIAITAFSPAGFGDWIGASIASSFGIDSTASAGDGAFNVYAVLPAYPAPMTRAELNEIHSQLAASEASMIFVRAATDEKLEHVRALSQNEELAVVATRPHVAAAPEANLRLALSEPVSYTNANEAPVEGYVAVTGPEARLSQASFTAPAPVGGGYDASVPYRDPHLELADLLLAHESF